MRVLVASAHDEDAALGGLHWHHPVQRQDTLQLEGLSGGDSHEKQGTHSGGESIMMEIMYWSWGSSWARCSAMRGKSVGVWHQSKTMEPATTEGSSCIRGCEGARGRRRRGEEKK